MMETLTGESPTGSTNAGNPEGIPDGLTEVTISKDSFNLTSKNLRSHTKNASIKDHSLSILAIMITP